MTTRNTVLPPAAVAVAALVLIASVAACTGGGGSPAASRGTATVANGRVEITAKDLTFSASTIEAPSGDPFTITLNNLEAQPHDIAVYVSEGGELIASVDPITGPNQTVDLQVPALEPGTYFFVCRVHSTLDTMKGSVVVTGG